MLHIQEFRGGGGGSGAVGYGGGHLADQLSAAVAGNIKTGSFGLAVFVCQNLACFVQVCQIRDEGGIGDAAQSNEDTVHAYFLPIA